ncbi:hypothetical protein BATDEDRAFT_89938 [Batrachochytrium dendrobatidis JAM81]|uniref:Cyclin N-terminal domain-containing protein n=2 Tax=Batrachochytrium dendrobatidis TaxID=109871 RepID=F4P697_BATDJ|nr:uncharacterized protein BATDEDRAFT_89938 [Batrachochytrium dendrobatidis JAM81]EGF79311.1 hypothetical protein BATDEDRAFT_89938 [Batrachochytrium dendrobatidis JAM81]KAJ8323009.1 hypothetical protein O5D80_008518 [Batrachochytrium dendrobatidis]KAK5665672.1 hypothetical protein QVD99_007322 [Batrachochytrium dendrobatidis]OAJ42606.1 hypothetical protein BDEG_26047 [Batrachochytrium dendrobatidis JEL423]|eukprot:XP_006680094.1 hypothetical protein BATDEDRAFT_89938 [Batrachochytrium dendrobatidis JAM81]
MSLNSLLQTDTGCWVRTRTPAVNLLLTGSLKHSAPSSDNALCESRSLQQSQFLSATGAEPQQNADALHFLPKTQPNQLHHTNNPDTCGPQDAPHFRSNLSSLLQTCPASGSSVASLQKQSNPVTAGSVVTPITPSSFGIMAAKSSSAYLENRSLALTLTSTAVALLDGTTNSSIRIPHAASYPLCQSRNALFEKIGQRVLAYTHTSVTTVYYGLYVLAVLTEATPFGSPFIPLVYPSSTELACQIPPEITLTVVALALADSILNDTSFPMSCWAAVSGVPVADLIRIRTCALKSLDYKLNIELSRFSLWVDFCPLLAEHGRRQLETAWAADSAPSCRILPQQQLAFQHNAMINMACSQPTLAFSTKAAAAFASFSTNPSALSCQTTAPVTRRSLRRARHFELERSKAASVSVSKEMTPPPTPESGVAGGLCTTPMNQTKDIRALPGAVNQRLRYKLALSLRQQYRSHMANTHQHSFTTEPQDGIFQIYSPSAGSLTPPSAMG